MIHLDNADVAELLTMEATIDALRIGFEQLAVGNAAHVPRLELWSPSADENRYHCLGSMSGTTTHFGIAAIRIKSDVLSWPEGRRQEKFAVEPGTYCGFILLFSTATGEPIAMINDGILQKMRVGASAGIAADHLARTDATTLGILGSGNMARVHLEAISNVRDLNDVRVFSPTQANREAFATEMSNSLGVAVAAVDSPDEAVRDRSIVVSATNAMGPTFDPRWLDDGTVVTVVTRREVSPELVERVDRVIQLDAHSIGPEANLPGLEWPQSAAGGFVAGSDEERERLPWKHPAESRNFDSLIDILRGDVDGRLSPEETILFINLGAQGVQFAAVAGHLHQLAVESGRGSDMAQGRFLQQVRD